MRASGVSNAPSWQVRHERGRKASESELENQFGPELEDSRIPGVSGFAEGVAAAGIELVSIPPPCPDIPNWVWFQAFKASAQNSSRNRSVKTKFLNSDRFQSSLPGSRTALSP